MRQTLYNPLKQFWNYSYDDKEVKTSILLKIKSIFTKLPHSLVKMTFRTIEIENNSGSSYPIHSIFHFISLRQKTNLLFHIRIGQLFSTTLSSALIERAVHFELSECTEECVRSKEKNTKQVFVARMRSGASPTDDSYRPGPVDEDPAHLRFQYQMILHKSGSGSMVNYHSTTYTSYRVFQK